MPDVSTLFELLADVTRRRVLFQLCGTESIRVPEDVRPDGTGASSGTATAPETRPPFHLDDHRSLRVELYHRHLPKLADAGLVDWDAETGVVVRGDRFATVEPALRLLDDNADVFSGELR